MALTLHVTAPTPTTAALSIRSCSAPPIRPKAEEHSEIARETGCSYRMSISRPSEILTM